MKIETVVAIELEKHFEGGNIAWCEKHASWSATLTQGYMFCVADYKAGHNPWYDKPAMCEAGCTTAFANAFHKAMGLEPTYVMVEAVD